MATMPGPHATPGRPFRSGSSDTPTGHVISREGRLPSPTTRAARTGRRWQSRRLGAASNATGRRQTDTGRKLAPKDSLLRPQNEINTLLTVPDPFKFETDRSAAIRLVD